VFAGIRKFADPAAEKRIGILDYRLYRHPQDLSRWDDMAQQVYKNRQRTLDQQRQS